VNEVDEPGQDVQLELQLDTVDECLDAFLVELEMLILEDDERDLGSMSVFARRWNCWPLTSMQMMMMLIVNNCQIMLREFALEMTLSRLVVFQR
jgi:hypothetical protein